MELERIHQLLGRYFAIRARSEQEIRLYLQRKSTQYHLSTNQITDLIEYYKELGLINDEKFAQSMIHGVIVSKFKGRRFAQMKLEQAGVERELIERSLTTISTEDVLDAMQRRLHKYSKKWVELHPWERKAKAYNTLLAAGFSSSEVHKFIDDWIQKA